MKMGKLNNYIRILKKKITFKKRGYLQCPRYTLHLGLFGVMDRT